ncbi:drug resistance transporter, EmrB/QacA subfamily [Streptosporangium subroseum]|uniref:Drug resistance transporter, EmrB/QacA subfamily n=1 Tax=Streptosporangium subroseum TaxID=106412 RepID=A0A239P7C8_9ACTN|nr:DHA2 family efflux MFS transporter permease subunit [Streptosporangium subroseum]SNT62604.1 drug resistance transporter, EmrB/QacA subfamily [Streptosporangium subroseum]
MSSRERTTVEQRRVLGLTSIGSVMVALDTLVVAAALTTIRQDLGASIEQLEWTVNAYSLSFAMLLVTAAAIGDRWGRRRMFAAGLVLFSVASIACALASSVPLLIAARAVQGVGAAAVMPMAMGLLGAAFPPERRGWAIGVFSGLTGLAVLGGPMIGGAVTQGLAWQWIFWINVPVGALAIPLVLRWIPESRGAARRLDPGGAALITLAVLGIVWGVVRGPAAGWNSSEVIGSFVLGGLLSLVFLAWERRAPQPMVPLTFFRSRAFSAGNAAGFFLTAALYGAVFFLAQFMQAAFGSGPLKAGLQLLPWTATLFLVAPVAGRLVDRIGERPLVVTGLALQAAGMFWIGQVGSGTVHYSELVLPLIVAGCGVSMAMPATQSAAIGALPRESVGIASGIYSMMRQLGGVVGVAVLAAVFAAAGGYESFTTGFTRALAVCGVLSLLGALAGLGIAMRRSATRPVARQELVEELR